MKYNQKFKQTEIGKIPEDWQVGQLSSIALIEMGQSPPGKSCNGLGSGIPLLNGPTEFGDNHPTPCQWTIEGRKHARKGDILFCVRGSTTGRMNWADQEYAIGRGIASIRHKNGENYQHYTRALLQNNLKHILAIATGSTFPNIGKEELFSIDIGIPELHEQLSISRVLSNFDNKIELNQRMDKTLEAIGQAVFKNWFINFEFPTNDGSPYKSSGGEMVDSRLGRIPKGWKAVKLGDFIRIERGLSYNGAGLANEGIPMINLGTMSPNKGFIYEGIKYYKGEYKDRNLVKSGDLVIANTDITQNREVLGSPAIVPNDLDADRILFTHHIYSVRNTSILSNQFIYNLLQLRRYKERVEGFATGTTVLALPPDVILDFEFVLPDEKTLKVYNELITRLYDKESLNNAQSRKLVQTRDALLPRLVSGKIRVPVEVQA